MIIWYRSNTETHLHVKLPSRKSKLHSFCSVQFFSRVIQSEFVSEIGNQSGSEQILGKRRERTQKPTLEGGRTRRPQDGRSQSILAIPCNGNVPHLAATQFSDHQSSILLEFRFLGSIQCNGGQSKVLFIRLRTRTGL